LTLAIGFSDLPAAQEIVFLGSMAIIVLMMRQLVSTLDEAKARALIGTAVIIFVFRAVPLPGPGATWFEIDVLGFDERFLAILSLITSLLAISWHDRPEAVDGPADHYVDRCPADGRVCCSGSSQYWPLLRTASLDRSDDRRNR
jgi:hypothetical protein